MTDRWSLRMDLFLSSFFYYSLAFFGQEHGVSSIEQIMKEEIQERSLLEGAKMEILKMNEAEEARRREEELKKMAEPAGEEDHSSEDLRDVIVRMKRQRNSGNFFINKNKKKVVSSNSK